MTTGGTVGWILLDLARWLIAQGQAEVVAHLARYWRSRDLGPPPPPLDRWDAIDRAHDEALRRRRAQDADEL